MAIIESIREFISQCPLMDDFQEIKVEFLPESIGYFSIEEVPTPITVEKYIDGDELRQFTFILAARFYYSDEAINNIDNSGWFERFVNWITDQNENGNLPVLDSGMNATWLEVTTSGYLFGVSKGMRDARYQVQCRLVYDYERK